MELTRSFRNKLLIFWLGSILVLLVVLGALYSYLHVSRLEDASLEHIGGSFSGLNTEIQDRIAILSKSSQAVAERQENVDILSMIDTYQDIENYQPLIFDQEKQKLSRKLMELGRAVGLDLLATHDSKSILASYYIKNHETNYQTGYLSFRDGKPVLFANDNAEGPFVEKEMLPVIQERTAINHPHDDHNMVFLANPRGIVMEIHRPVVRKLSDNSSQTVGVVHAAYLLDDRLFQDIPVQKGLEFAFLLPDGTRFGNLEAHLSVEDFPETPVLNLHGSTRPLFQQIASKDYMLGATRFPLTDGRHAYYIFGEKKPQLMEGLEPVIFAAIMLIGILITLAMYYMNRTFTKPMEDLLSGVEGLRDGTYKKLSDYSGVDELSTLARSFNTMSQAIQTRERDLRESEERFRALANYTPNKLHIKDLEGRYILINLKSEEIYGITNEEALGKTVTDFFPPETAKVFINHDQAVMETGEPIEVEESFLLEDGAHTFLTVKFPILGADGDMVAVGSSGFEITERKRVEEQLYKTFNINPYMMAIIDFNNGVLLDVNQAWVSGFGFEHDEAVGNTALNLGIWYDESDRQKLIAAIKEGGRVRNFETRMKTKCEEILHVSISAEMYAIAGVDYVLIGEEDITDRKRSEAQLIQSAKLASLGEMATGIAHEINQPLNVIRMSSEILTEMLEVGEVPSSDYLKTKLERITSQVERAAIIIDRMRIFGRAPLENATEISPRDAVLGAVSHLHEQFRLDGIKLELDVPETSRLVMGDRIQLEQVVLNLLTNARDAIEGRVETISKDEGSNSVTVRIEDDQATSVIKVIIEDTGGGIPEDVLPKIFEPFLTTKDIGKGTGLGLSISYGIIKNIGGGIEATNVGGGARFTITLPVAEEALE